MGNVGELGQGWPEGREQIRRVTRLAPWREEGGQGWSEVGTWWSSLIAIRC